MTKGFAQDLRNIADILQREGWAIARIKILGFLDELEATQWQPIESAPKDPEIMFDVWCFLNGYPEVKLRVANCWWYGKIWNLDLKNYTPTHWMPIPEGPKS